MSDPNNTGQPAAPPPQHDPPPPPPPPAAAPPPQQNWQSTPQPPAAPPPAGGQPGASGAPAWTSNLTAQGTIPGPGGVALADVLNRFIAAFIDFVILAVIGFIVSTITTAILGDNLAFIFGNVRVPSLLSTIVAAALMIAVSAAYFIYQWLRMDGATLGMKVMKLSVRDAGSGGPITQQQAINRWLLLGAPWGLAWLQYGIIGLLLSIAVLVWYIYLLVTIAQSPSRQGFHDQYSKTVVAKVG